MSSIVPSDCYRIWGKRGDSCREKRVVLSYWYMTATLSTKVRTESKRLNLTEIIPGVVYGPKQTPIRVEVNRKEFEKLFKVAGESTVIELTGLDKKISTLVKDVAFSPTKGGIVHVDFYALEKGKEVEAHVPLHFIGESGATKLGAVVNKVLHEVMVVSQPDCLPAHIDVDLALLSGLESRITVGDIVLPKGVAIKADAHEVVALVEVIKDEPVEASVAQSAEIPVEAKEKDEPVA